MSEAESNIAESNGRASRPRRLRRTKRFRQIIRVLARYGLQDFVAAIGLGGGRRVFRRIRRRTDSDIQPSEWSNLRMAFEELGPTFIKFGQVMSMRRDMLPANLVLELEKLQDTVPPFESRTAREILETVLGTPLDRVFSDFTDEPMASASIAQVHRAVLHDGNVVAVKIKRPDIDRLVRADIAILQTLASLAERYLPILAVLRPKQIVAEFKRSILRELDLNRERMNAERLRTDLVKEPDARVPRFFEQYCGDAALVMELIDAPKVSRVLESTEARSVRNELAKRITRLVLSQIFEHGFFHADPHPGNILVMPDRKICFIDLGMMGIVSPTQREVLGRFLVGIATGDPPLVASALLSLTSPLDVIDRDELAIASHRLADDYAAMPLKHFNMQSAIADLMTLVTEFRLRLPANIVVLLKALATVAGVSRELDPDFNIIGAIRPFALRVMRNEFAPRNLRKEVFASALEYGRLVRKLPTDARDIIDLVKKGKVKLTFDQVATRALRKIAEEAANTFTIGLILAALLISSSLIVLSGIPPLWSGVPAIGLIGYILSGVLAVGLLVSMVYRAIRR